MIPLPPTSPLFPYTTLFRSIPTHKIWQEKFKAIAAEYPGIQSEHRYVDALALELVREPARFQVIVTNKDRKSTRLNSSHQIISYAVFCLKKKKKNKNRTPKY